MLTSFMELVRMIRDGDSESDDAWAKQMYDELNG